MLSPAHSALARKDRFVYRQGNISGSTARSAPVSRARSISSAIWARFTALSAVVFI